MSDHDADARQAVPLTLGIFSHPEEGFDVAGEEPHDITWSTSKTVGFDHIAT